MADDLKQMAKTRLLDEMLGSVKQSGGADWSVLIMDAVTTRVMSHSCRISDVLDYGVSLVDMVTKRREPLPNLSGVYFITPSMASVGPIIEDFKFKPLYKTAHIFFSSKCPPAVLQEIRGCSGLMARLKSLNEVNLEFLVVDKRTFLTDKERALQTLFGEGSEQGNVFSAEVATIADRLASAFASLKEYPSIRYRAPKPGENGATDLQSLVAQRIALTTDERLAALQRSGQVPSSESCELIITDRGFDPVAPIIHEWTYEAMIYDLLPLEGNVYKYEFETEGGKVETKAHILDERDAIWVDLQHEHFASASLKISAMLDEFRKKNQAVSYINRKASGTENGGNSGALDMRGMRNLVKSLPQYREQLAQLSVHADIASKLNRLIDEKSLVEMGKLEQDLVYGNATSKEVVTFLGYHQQLPTHEKVRLLMCYVATHPEKLDATKQQQWQKLAGLSAEDMTTITNLEFLGVPVRKQNKTKGLNFGRKRKRAVRKDRPAGQDEQTWELSRFVPMLQEVVEDLAASTLSTDEYPYVRTPQQNSNGAAGGAKGASVRTNRTAGWARKASGVVAGGPGIDTATKGKRVIVFVIGGITRSEMRVAHTLSKRLARDITLGSTSLDDPATFMHNLYDLGNIDYADEHTHKQQYQAPAFDDAEV